MTKIIQIGTTLMLYNLPATIIWIGKDHGRCCAALTTESRDWYEEDVQPYQLLIVRPAAYMAACISTNPQE